MVATTQPSARERILDAALVQYYAEGIRAVSADKLIAIAGVSKVTFYRHFPTKDDLIAAYLAEFARHERETVTAKRAELADDPAGVLLWYAAIVGEVACAPGSRGCVFINAAAELPDEQHPGRVIVSEHRTWLTDQLAELLSQLGIADPTTNAERIVMLRDGAMVSGYLGRSPQQVAEALVDGVRSIIGR